jgi:lipopolysaccharide export system permease protein
MRILDRYILGMFLKNYLISFMVLVGLYVVLDMVFNFDDLVVVHGQTAAGSVVSTLALVRNLASFYMHQVFLFFVHLSGIIPVVAAAFTLVRLSRFNELTAILAAGVPLLRVALPIILAAVALNVLVIIDQEVIIPSISHQLIRRHSDLASEGGSAYPISALQDENRAILNAGLYLPPDGRRPARIEELDVTFRDERFDAVSHLTARTATWDPHNQRWNLAHGQIVHGLQQGQRISDPQPVAIYQSNITPHEIALYRRGSTVQLLSTAQINELLEREQLYGRINLLRMKHARFTQPLANVMLLLLAIPAVLTREPSRLKVAAAQCLLLVGLAMGSMFVAHQIAGTPPTTSPALREAWPALMAWMPILIFGPIAVWLLDRIRT